MIILDASVVIAYASLGDASHPRAADLLETETDDFGMHAVTIAECLVGPARTGQSQRMLALLAAMEVVRIDLDEEGPLRVAELRAASGLKLPDAFVLDAAIRTGARLATFDARLAASASEHAVEVVGAPAA